MATEYALLTRSGEIVDVVTTERSLQSIKSSYPGYIVKRLEDLPDAVKERYRFWNERP